MGQSIKTAICQCTLHVQNPPRSVIFKHASCPEESNDGEDLDVTDVLFALVLTIIADIQQ